MVEDRYRVDPYSVVIEYCPLTKACMGGNVSGADTCLGGTEGPLCAICSSDYYYAPASKSCLSCNGLSIVGSLVSIVILFVLVLIGGIVVLRYHMGSSRFRLIVGNLRDTAAMVGIGFAAGQAPQNRRQSQVLAAADRVSPIRKIQSKVKIVVALFQILTSLPWTLSLQFPPIFAWFLSILNLFNFDVSGILPLDCVSTSNFWLELVITTFVPLGVAVVIGLVAMASAITAIARRRGTVCAEDHTGSSPSADSTFSQAFLMLTYLVYPGVASKIFRGLRPCHKLDDGESYMVEDYSINCSSPTYANVLLLCYIMTVVYVIGIPLMYTVILHRHQHHIQSEGSDRRSAINEMEELLEKLQIRSVDTGSRVDTEVVMMELDRLFWCYSWSYEIAAFDFLFAAYRPDRWWWEIFETFRRLALTGLLVFLVPGSSGQILLALIIAVMCGILYVGMAPFVDSMDCSVSNTAQVSLIVVLFTALAIQLELMVRSCARTMMYYS